MNPHSTVPILRASPCVSPRVSPRSHEHGSFTPLGQRIGEHHQHQPHQHNEDDQEHNQSMISGGSIGLSHANIQRMGSFTPHMEDKLRRKVKFYFMNPCEKWKARRRFPWKLLLQIFKLVLVNVQLIIFGYDRSAHINFLEKNNLAFEHVFLKKWDPTFETMPYPPAIGKYAVYTRPVLDEYLNFALEAYDNVSKSLGTYDYLLDENGTKVPMQLCKTYFNEANLQPSKKKYTFDSRVDTKCVPLVPLKNGTMNNYSVKDILESQNVSFSFERLVKLELKFPLMTIHLRTKDAVLDEPDCFQFDVTILYDNSGHNGEVPITIKFEPTTLECHGHLLRDDDNKSALGGLMAFDVFIIVISALSMTLCIRSLFRAQQLKAEVVDFFLKRRGKKLSVYDRLEFLDMWYVLIVINDIVTIAGSACKLELENKDSNNYENAGILLGTGSLFVWFGVLRYLGFFEKYNILILTMKRASPNIIRFLTCAMFFYFGFTLCGWVVLGPYHIKFRSVSTASECLFSLVNGDDMFVTFSVIGENANPVIWYYSRIFLYTFISLFIYVVLSLFIAVIMDTYETIKYHYEHGFPKGELMDFVEQCTDEVTSSLYQTEDHRGCDTNIFCCCCQRKNPDDIPNEYTSLIR